MIKIVLVDKIQEFVNTTDRNVLFLNRDNWDDYGAKTSFLAVFRDRHGRSHSLGKLKIMQHGQGSGFVFLEGEFARLDQTYASLGQSQSYYETLMALDGDVGRNILEALRDVVLDSERFDRFEIDPTFQNSLLREIGGRQIKTFRQLIVGHFRRTQHHFRYQRSDVDFDFHVRPNSIPPSNLHAIIGRNGVGKTTLLADLAHAACAKIDQLDSEHGIFLQLRGEAAGSIFGNVVAVSFSAFDSFSVPRNDGTEALSIKYDYVGLRVLDEARLKSRDEITSDLVESLGQCLFSSRKEPWLNAIRVLSSDPVFARLPLRELAELTGPDEIQPFRALFEEMSSGHQIVLLSITRLVELVQDRTLVLFDEPECHLHPPLIASLIRALTNLLRERNGVAIVTTHSPVVLQEIPSSCAWILDRFDDRLSATPMPIESFAENVGVLTEEVFGLELKESNYYSSIKRVIERPDTRELADVIQAFSNHIGSEGKSVALALLTAKKNN